MASTVAVIWMTWVATSSEGKPDPEVDMRIVVLLLKTPALPV